ncbi:nucleotide-diphospho-sugar transferase [Pedobacter sp. 22226]|uniref:nucleotide-diphospho-sugar transferase n=1 Tax=Pedobacter sp. 22226 TaxID=3453894 RepID=UPI003F8278FE
MLDTPVLFLIFNRPETTIAVFEEIKKAKPKQLFVAADGPRKGNENDLVKCAVTRNLILNGIDWPCELKTLFREENCGCGEAVSGGINWFFEHVEQGIILEDDCLPNHSFFVFCAELLKYHQNNNRIMEITGTNVLAKKLNLDKDSYYYSSYGSIWGWATWKRAWEKYDFNISGFSLQKEELIQQHGHQSDFNDWMNSFSDVYEKKIDTWDYQWVYTLWMNQGLCIVPVENMITNIGFGAAATHTTGENQFSNLQRANISAIIKHPKIIAVNKKSDQMMSKIFTSKQKYQLLSKLYAKIKKFL